MPSMDGLSPAEQRVLDAIAWLATIGNSTPSKTAVALIAKYRPTSGGYANLLGKLRSAGHIAYGPNATVGLTESGQALANIPEAPMDTLALHETIIAVLSPAEARVLKPIIAVHPSDESKEAIAVEAGYQPTSGGYANLLGTLRTLGLIEYSSPGRVRASDLLFL